MAINYTYKRLSLSEVFQLARSIISPKSRDNLPRLLSKLFDASVMHNQYEGARQVIPNILKKYLRWPDVIVLTDPEKIISLLKAQKQNRPDIVSRAVEMVEGVPNIFTAQEIDVWRQYRVPMGHYLKARDIDESDITIAEELIEKYCVDRKIHDVADFTAIYSARVFGKKILGYDFKDQEALDIANSYSNILQPKIMASIVSNAVIGRDLYRTKKQDTQIKQALRIFSDITNKIIRHAIENPDKNSYTRDLIDSVTKEGEEFSFNSKEYKFVASQIMIMLAGGIEAPRKQLYTAMHYLARNPQYQDDIKPDDIKGDIRDKGVYRILLEATRLGSPVYCMWKETEDKTQYVIPLSAILSSQYHWGEDSHFFNPNRFLDDPDKLKSKAMFAFGYGRHGCPGELKAYCQNGAMLVALTRNGSMQAHKAQLAMPPDRVSFLAQPVSGTQIRYSVQPN